MGGSVLGKEHEMNCLPELNWQSYTTGKTKMGRTCRGMRPWYQAWLRRSSLLICNSSSSSFLSFSGLQSIRCLSITCLSLENCKRERGRWLDHARSGEKHLVLFTTFIFPVSHQTCNSQWNTCTTF